MIGIITSPINIRASMSTTSQDMGDLAPGDVVIGTVIDGWIAFDRVFRKTLGISTPEALGFTRYAALYQPGIPSQKYMMLVDASTPAPAPEPVAKAFSITVEGVDYQTATVEVKPK